MYLIPNSLRCLEPNSSDLKITSFSIINCFSILSFCWERCSLGDVYMFFFSKNHTGHIPHWILSIKQGWKSSIFSQALVAQAFYNLDRSKMIEQFLKRKIVLNFNEMLFKNTYCLAFLGSVSSFKRTQLDYMASVLLPRAELLSVLWRKCVHFFPAISSLFLSFHRSICRQSFQHDILIYGGWWRWFPQCL